MATNPELGDGRTDRLARTNWTALERGDFEHFVLVYWKPVFRYLRKRLPTDEWAEEVTQEFFLRFLERNVLARVDPSRGRFRNFLFHAARDFLVDHFRERGAAKRWSGSSTLSLSEAQNVESTVPEASEEFDRQWWLSLVNRARRELKAYYGPAGKENVYMAFRLFYFGGGDSRGKRTHKEIAEAIGCTPAQVNNYLHRARQNYARILRGLVSEYCATEEEVAAEMLEFAAFLERHRLGDWAVSSVVPLPPSADE